MEPVSEGWVPHQLKFKVHATLKRRAIVLLDGWSSSHHYLRIRSPPLWFACNRRLTKTKPGKDKFVLRAVYVSDYKIWKPKSMKPDSENNVFASFCPGGSSLRELSSWLSNRSDMGFWIDVKPLFAWFKNLLLDAVDIIYQRKVLCRTTALSVLFLLFTKMDILFWRTWEKEKTKVSTSRNYKPIGQ